MADSCRVPAEKRKKTKALESTADEFENPDLSDPDKDLKKTE